ncbi:MAG: alpha/beta fold hydrolase [Candidatus Heimdallarchaeaceae archaeon]
MKYGRKVFSRWKAEDSLSYEFSKQPSTTILFMIHGAHRQLQDSYAFSKNIDVLDQKFTSISISLLGHGKSAPGKGTTIKNKSITIKDQISILNNLVSSELEGKQFIFIGRSYGARIAMRLALINIMNTLGLILISPRLQLLSKRKYITSPLFFDTLQKNGGKHGEHIQLSQNVLMK